MSKYSESLAEDLFIERYNPERDGYMMTHFPMQITTFFWREELIGAHVRKSVEDFTMENCVCNGENHDV